MFQAACAAFTLARAVETVKGGLRDEGGRAMLGG